MDMSRRERAMAAAKRLHQGTDLPPMGSGLLRKPPGMASELLDIGAVPQPPTQGSGKELWAPTDWELIIRILPAIDLRPWYVAIPYHYLDISADDGMVCRAYVNAACHLCEQVEAWSLSPDPVDHARALLMQRTHRCLLQVIDLKALDHGVQVWCASERMLERLLAYRNDPEYGDFTDPERGRNVRMVQRRAGERLGCSAPQLCPHRSPMAYPHWRDAIDGVVPLPVEVRAKKTRLDTEALQGFDDI